MVDEDGAIRSRRSHDAAGFPRARIDGTQLIGQCRDCYDLDDEVGMRKCGNADDLRGRRVVVAALLGAMLSKELVHHVLAEVGRTQYAAVGERSFHEKRKLDQVVQRGAQFLQIGLDVRKYDAPLRDRVACGA